MASYEKKSSLGPFKPTLILHGGAGSLSRTNLPPELYTRYHASLLRYLTVTRELLDSGTSALEAACHAVTLFEDDPLFNCGKGAVFTERGTIEMEASVMVCSIDPAGPPAGEIKRGAAVSLIKNTRHPILLAKEVLVAADEDHGLGGTSTMHCHLSGRDVEEWGWTEKGLEKKPDRWFWTKRRWEEHRRGLHRQDSYTYDDLVASVDPLSERLGHDEDDLDGVKFIPSQGTVGAVCLDTWGNLAVATSTGGLTNKKAGRIGDTPTIGAGFWAEAWDEDTYKNNPGPLPHRLSQHMPFLPSRRMPVLDHLRTQTNIFLGSCLNLTEESEDQHPPQYQDLKPPQQEHISPNSITYLPYTSPRLLGPPISSLHQPALHRRRRAIAMSGTGNGDSFLRTNACRTAASICRLGYRYPGTHSPPLADAIRSVAGPNGELQCSAGNRWGKTGEGQGGIIGIEVFDDDDNVNGKRKMAVGRVVFDFNCGGLFRAYYEVEGDCGQEMPKVMVFKDEY